MNEADVSTKVRVALEEAGAPCWKVSDRFHAGRPDLIACYQGQLIMIEMKIWPNQPTDIQKYELDRFALARAWAYCVWYNKTTREYFATSYPNGPSAQFKSLKDLTEWLLRSSSTKQN